MKFPASNPIPQPPLPAIPKAPTAIPGMPSIPGAAAPPAPAPLSAVPALPTPAGPPGPPLQGTPEWIEMHQKAYDLAGAKGTSPEHAAARTTVIKSFLKMHDPDQYASSKTFIDTVDLGQPVRVVNGKTTDIHNPKPTGFFGRGRKPAYLVSKKFPPQEPTDPEYALEFYPKA